MGGKVSVLGVVWDGDWGDSAPGGGRSATSTRTGQWLARTAQSNSVESQPAALKLSETVLSLRVVSNGVASVSAGCRQTA